MNNDLNFKWTYYNNALLPLAAPHEIVDASDLNNKLIWKKKYWNGNKPLLARWTTDFDCKEETNWWWIIQDEKFDMGALNSHDRRRINVGLRNFNVKRINPINYAEKMAEIAYKDYLTYPKQNQNGFSMEERTKLYSKMATDNFICHGAFYKETGELCAFHFIKDCGTYYEMSTGKSNPEFWKKYVNAALVYSFCQDVSDSYSKGKYLTNGQRGLNHITNFDNDLIRYYGFRKAFCRLNIRYKKSVGIIVKILFPIRKFLSKFDKIKIMHKINVILKMEEISRGI